MMRAMSGDLAARRSFMDRFKLGDRVLNAHFGGGVIREIGGNCAFIAFDNDDVPSDEASLAGCRVILFDDVEACS
jgi:hypothetical protein